MTRPSDAALAICIGNATAYSRRPGWKRWLIRLRNNLLPWFLYEV